LSASAIELNNVSVVRNGQPILTDVNLAIEAGTCCAVLGPNGAGKSALVAVMSGYLWPSEGTVAVDGRRYGRVSLSEVRRTIGLIEPSRSPPFDGRVSVRDVVATGLFGTVVLPPQLAVSDDQWRRADAALAGVGLASLASRRYGLLSTGEQMKAALARAMVADARILLLDEPTVGLDMGARAACIGVLDELLARPAPPTVVIVSHHLDELPRAVQSVVFVKAGRLLAQGAPAELITSANLSELFDCHVTVFRAGDRFAASVDGGGCEC
jgi:iron complex transport system ATP-binding protein